MLKPKRSKIKHYIAAFIILVMVITYFMAIDPETSFLANLPFGIKPFMTLEIFVIGVLGIIIIEFLPDVFLDRIFPYEIGTFDKAVETSEGAASTMVAKSIRILAYSIVIAAAIVTYGARV